MGIAKVGKSGGSGGVLNYVLKNEHAQIIGGNVSGTKEEIKEQFEAFETARSTLTKNTTHITWSFAPGETVSDEKAVELAEALLEKLKFEKTPYLIVRHSDKEKRETEPYEHIHIVAGRIRTDASVVPDFQIARRTIAAVKELEQEHGLQQTPFVDRSLESQPKREELKMIERTGELSARLRLQEQIKEVAKEFPQTGEFVEELERRGIAVEFNLQKTGRIAGVSFATEGVAFKGSSLGKSYSWMGLQKQQGLSYEHERDFDACQKASQRAGRGRLERAPQNRVESVAQSNGVGQNGKRAAERGIGQTGNGLIEHPGDGLGQARARGDEGDHHITTENQAVGRSEHGLGASAQRLAAGGREIGRGAEDKSKAMRRSGERLESVQRDVETARHGFEQTGNSEQVLEGEGGRADKGVGHLENGALGHVESGRRSDDSGNGGFTDLDRAVVRRSTERFDLDAGTGNAIRDSAVSLSAGGNAGAAELGDEVKAEERGRSHSRQKEQKAAAVTQAINLAYGGSLPSEVQEGMTAQLTEAKQLNDYYERTRLTRWQETIEMSQTFVQATAESLGATIPQPPETEGERNERLKGWMQATAKVAVYAETGRQLDQEYAEQVAERFAAGASKTVSESEIEKLERLAERRGVAPPLVTTQSETRAAMMMSATREEIATPLIKGEQGFVQEREQKAQKLAQAKEERQQARGRGGYGFSR